MNGFSIVNNRTDGAVTVPLSVVVPDPCIGSVRPDVLRIEHPDTWKP